MTQTVTVDKHIRRPVEEVGAFVADPHRFIPVLATVGRCEYLGDSGGDQLWDVFLASGTLFVGGRVLVTSGHHQLSWRSLRGTRHSFEARAEGDGHGSRFTATLRFSLTGLGVARLSEVIGRGIVGRNVQAAAEELRHQLEFEDGKTPIE